MNVQRLAEKIREEIFVKLIKLMESENEGV